MTSSDVETSSLDALPQFEAGLHAPRASDHLNQVLTAYSHAYGSPTILKFEGDDSASIYCALSGWLAASKSMVDGGRQIIDVVLPGEVMDLSSGYGHTSSVQIETLSHAVVAIVPHAVWARLRETTPEIRNAQSATIAVSLSRIFERMLRLGKGTAESRIAYAMIELCMRLEVAGACRNGTFHLPLTQQVLGDFVGLSAVHVCRTLRRLGRRGVLSTEGHMTVVIHDAGALADIAGIDLAYLRREIIAAQ